MCTVGSGLGVRVRFRFRFRVRVRYQALSSEMETYVTGMLAISDGGVDEPFQFLR